MSEGQRSEWGIWAQTPPFLLPTTATAATPRQSTTATPAINWPFVGGSSGRREKEFLLLLFLLLLVLVLVLLVHPCTHTFEELGEETINLTQGMELRFQNSCLSLHLSVLLPNHHNKKRRESLFLIFREISTHFTPPAPSDVRAGC